MHFEWSPNLQNDDRKLEDYSRLESSEVVASIKMDGENCLAPETPLKTENGDKTIKEICETEYSGKVLSKNLDTNESEFQKIIGHSIIDCSQDDEWYDIEIENGEILTLTSEHYVWLPILNCYRKVKDLKAEDEIDLLL